MTGYYLVDIALVAITFAGLSVSWLVFESIIASKRIAKTQKEHTCEGPEVVLIPMGGPMTPMTPPVKH